MLSSKKPGMFLLSVILSTVMSVPANATPDVHCTGDETNHGSGSAPQPEQTESGGQCHGVPGDQGSCDVVYEGNEIGQVFCISITLPGGTEKQNCRAQVNCAPNAAVSCFSPGGEAYAGITSESGNNRGFIQCGSQAPEVCPQDL